MSEEIIIDGVNVAECEYLNTTNMFKTCICSKGEIKKCQGVNCKYKELQRLKQENEELKYENDRQKDTIIYLNNYDMCHKTLIQYKQALEEINKIAIKEYYKKLEDKDCIECDESFLKIREFCDEVLND